MAVQGDCTRPCIREAVASNRFASVFKISRHPWSGGSNLLSTGSVQVAIVRTPVAIEWHLCGVQETLNAFRDVAIMAH